MHKGGSTWNWSVGCLTVHTSQYDGFIGHYSWGKWGRVYLIGDWNGAFEPPSDMNLRPVDSLNLTTTGLGSVSFNVEGSTVNAVVINNGNLDAGAFGISVWINGGHFVADLDGLAAGEQQIVPIATNIRAAGVYKYSVLVDRTALLDEIDEADNKVEGLITVADSSVQLTVEHPNRVVQATPVTFRGLAIGVRAVRVSVDNWIIYQEQVTGESYEFSYSFFSVGNDRHVEVAGLDENSRLLTTATSRIQVTEANILEIVAPLDGQTLSNPVTFRIDASPDIAKVVYRADGKDTDRNYFGNFCRGYSS